MSIFSFKNKPSLSFVLDIRDFSVSVAVTKFNGTNKPEILGCQNFKIKTTDTANHEKYTESMLKTLDEGVITMRKKLARAGNKEKIDRYYFFVGSPWSISESKSIKVTKNRPFEITKEIIEKIISDEEIAARNDISGTLKKENWKILEEKIIQFKLDGYKVEKIFDKKINSMEAEIFVSFIPDNIYSYMSQLIKTEELGGGLNSSTLASYVFFRDIFSDKNNFVYIDIGQFVTDVFLVKDDVISGTASFPIGEREILRIIRLETNLDDDTVLSYINMFCHESCDEDTKKMIKKSLRASSKIWLEKLNDSISKITEDVDMPKDIFIIENTNMIKSLLKEMDSEIMKVSMTKMKINRISENLINDLIINAKTFNNEPYIKMDIVFLNKTIK